MKQLSFWATVLLVCTCCKNNTRGEYFEVIHETISNGIPVNFPGTMLVDSNYIYLETPTSTDFGLRLYDIQSGEEIGRFITKGRGPEEFITTSIQQVMGKSVYFISYNPTKEVSIDISNAENGESKISYLSGGDIEQFTSIQYIDDTSRIALQPLNRNLFKYYTPTRVLEFGEFISTNMIENRYEMLQGTLRFNFRKEIAVFAASRISYIGIYRYSDQSFNLINEVKDTRQYKLEGNKIVTKNSQKGCGGLSLTEDYIVTIQRDYEKDNTDENTVGRDASKLPQTMFVYSYKGILQKIVDLKAPVIRIAGTQHNNTIYAIIYQDKEFKIIKFNI